MSDFKFNEGDRVAVWSSSEQFVDLTKVGTVLRYELGYAIVHLDNVKGELSYKEALLIKVIEDQSRGSRFRKFENDFDEFEQRVHEAQNRILGQ